MEASTLQPPAALAKPRIAIGAPLLRFRSDEQLVALFRAGHEEAFRAIHERYHRRLFAYARQMLPGRQDAEDALQDVFVRAYSGLRASDRDLALRAWLFRVAHNRCVDELRKPTPPPPEVLQLVRSTAHDPLVEVDLRDSLRRLVEDIRRLPDQQRSALLMRELAGMSYADVANSLGTSIGAVKSLLVRARLALAQAAEARETACTVIREQIVEAHDRGVRPTAKTRKHMRDCSGCKHFRGELRGVSRQLAGVTPATGAFGFLTKLIGFSGGGGAGASALLGGGGSAASTGGIALSANHIATLIVAAVATAGSAVEIQHTILPQVNHLVHAASAPAHRGHRAAARAPASSTSAVQTGVTSEIAESAPIAFSPAADSAVTSQPTRTAATTRQRIHSGTKTKNAATKQQAGSGSTTAAEGSTTSSLTSQAGSCTPAVTAPAAAASTSSSSTSTSSVSSTAATTDSTTTSSPSSSTAPTTTSPCDSTTGSSAGAPAPSSSSSDSGTSSSSDSPGSTSAGSASGTTASSDTASGSSGTGSNQTTG